jgi:hypothetical protein
MNVWGLAVGLLVVIWSGCTEQGVKMKLGGKAKGRILTVDNSGDAGHHVDMDLDAQDRVHLVYYDRKNQSLKYVRHTTAGLSTEVVDDTCKRCLYAAIRVTGDFEPHIVYYSDLNQTLTYAYRKDGRWKREAIEWGQGTGMGARLQFDEQQRIHALYYSGDGYLKHAWRVPNQMAAEPSVAKSARKAKPGPVTEVPEGIWGNERVDKANGSEKVSISFIRQANGKFACSYFHWSGLSSEVRVAIQDEEGKWSIDMVAFEHSPGKSSALFFDRQGEPRVVFREALKDRLSMAQLEAEGWVSTPLLADAYNMSLAIDGTYNILVGYERMSGRDPRKGQLRMAWRQDWQWQDFEVDSTAGSGSFLSAGLTAAGRPILAYFEETNKSLRLFLGE